MSADAFHKAIQQNMQANKFLYNFDDFADCVATALPYVKVIQMTPEMFKDRKSFKSPAKMEAREKQLKKKFYLKDVNHIKVTQGSYTLEYGTTHEPDEKLEELDFLDEDMVKSGFPLELDSQIGEVGIDEDRKKCIEQS